MLPESALRSMNVLWATPCYISAVSMNYVTSLFTLACRSMEYGLASALYMHSESLITRGRNEIVRHFLKNEEYTHIFWIDADIEFSAQAVFRLLLSDLDVVSGVYPLKKLVWPVDGLPAKMTQKEFESTFLNFAFNPIVSEGKQLSEYATGDGFMEVAEAPTGFMLIKRQVFQKLMESYPDLNYVPDGPSGNPDAKYYWRFFDCIIDPDTGRYLSEDYTFCRRWRDIGGKVYVDLRSDFGHLGQYLYRGRVEDTLRIHGFLPPANADEGV